MGTGRRSGGFRKSSSGQAPVLAGLLFLLLVPTTIILAENATLNITGDLLANLTPDNGTAFLNTAPVNASLDESPENSSNSTLPGGNASLPWGNQTLVNQTISPENQTNATLPEGNATLPSGNQTNATSPAENATGKAGNQTNATVPGDNATAPGNLTNQTSPVNETKNITANETTDNSTMNETGNQTLSNITLQNDTQNITANQTNLTGPELTVSLSLPGRADRGHAFNVTALVRNTGDLPAEGARLEWILPEGFVVLQGSTVREFGLGPGSSMESRLLLEAPLTAELGAREIKARVVYHD